MYVVTRASLGTDLVPLVVMLPQLYGGEIELGQFMQANKAFNKVQNRLTFIFKRWVEVNELASVVWRLRELESGLREGARASAAACNGCAGADGLEHSGTEVRRMPMRGRRCWGEGAGGARWTPLKQLPV